jgi:hypothetical protein
MSPISTSPSVFFSQNFNVSKFTLGVFDYNMGRVFQDRSHTFKIKRAPPLPKTGVIYNLNVVGKRGPAILVHPSLTYQFVPSSLTMRVFVDQVHVQWTGGTDGAQDPTLYGQGMDGTDRHNMVVSKCYCAEVACLSICRLSILEYLAQRTGT